MIVLKNMARELGIDPYKLRCMLRKQYGKAPKGSWRWPTRTKDYEAKLRKMKSLISKKNTSVSSGKPSASSPPKPIPQPDTNNVSPKAS